VAKRSRELDSFDVIEGLVIEGGINVEVLNAISLHGGLIGSWPNRTIFARTTVQAMIEHWKVFGLPAYAQFDNDTRFQGAHQFRDTLGRVIRLCLSLGVTAVFAPPRETGFKPLSKVSTLAGKLRSGSAFISNLSAPYNPSPLDTLPPTASVPACASNLPPSRRLFPSTWKFDLQARPKGSVIYLRRTDAHGRVSLLGHSFVVDSSWPHRLVRAHVDLTADQIRFHALRRREPTWQPIVTIVPYQFPKRRFRDDHQT